MKSAVSPILFCIVVWIGAGVLHAQRPYPLPTPASEPEYVESPLDIRPQPGIGEGEGEETHYGPPASWFEDYTQALPFTSGSWWRSGIWYGELDFVVWHRTRPQKRLLGLDNSGVGIEFHETLNQEGKAFGVEPGARATLGYLLCRDMDNRDHSVEFTYLGFNNWEMTDSLTSEEPRNLRVPMAPNVGGFNFADSYSTFNRSSLHSMELNYRIRNRPGRDRMIMGPDGFWSRQLTPGRTQSLVLGVRGLSVDENFRWLALRDDTSPSVFFGDYTVNTDNTLLGVQIGGDCLDVHEGWFWGIKGKAGVFVNFVEGSADILINDSQAPQPDIHGRATDDTSAFFGELSFMLGFNLTDNLILRASYDLALVGGIALAPDQVSFDTNLAAKPAIVNAGGQIFYNGLSLGFEAYW